MDLYLSSTQTEKLSPFAQPRCVLLGGEVDDERVVGRDREGRWKG